MRFKQHLYFNRLNYREFRVIKYFSFKIRQITLYLPSQNPNAEVA